MHPLLAPLVIVPVFFLVGWGLERTLVRRVLGAEPIISLLLLFGVWLVLQNLAYVIWTGDTRSIETPFVEAAVERRRAAARRAAAVRLRDGRADPRRAAALPDAHVSWAARSARRRRTATRRGWSAIDVDRVMGIAFGIGIALAGFGGSLLSLLFSFTPDFGRALSLKSFCIVVLGGLDSIIGVAFGSARARRLRRRSACATCRRRCRT